VSDVPLPIVVDEAVTWKVACPGHWGDMCPAGVLLTTPEHSSARALSATAGLQALSP
jgi:hypothetical protein